MNKRFFIYFFGFGEKPFNPQKSISGKIDLVTTHLQERIFICQDNFRYLAEIDVLVSIIFNFFSENVI